MRCGFWPLVHSWEYPWSLQSFSKWENSRCIFEKLHCYEWFINSTTYTVASSFCMHFAVGNSAEFMSFLLNMCMLALESTTNSVSSGFYYGWRWETPFVGRWEEGSFVRFFVLWGFLGQSPRVSAGTSPLSLSLFLRPILNFGSVRTALMRIFWLISLRVTDLCFFRMFAWRSVAFVNRSRRLDPKTFVLFRKIVKDSGGSMSWNMQPNCRESFNKTLHFCHHPSSIFLLGWSSTCLCANDHFSPNLHPEFCFVEFTFGRTPIVTRWFGANTFDVISALLSSKLPRWTSTSEILSSRSFCGRRSRGWSGLWCRVCTLILTVWAMSIPAKDRKTLSMNQRKYHLRVKITSREVWMMFEQCVGLERKWKRVECGVVLIW